KPFFAGLDEHLNDDDGSGGGGFIGANQLQLNSPARSSPHSNGSETTERFSRKVFVGGLPPDIDEEEITTSFNQYGDLIVDWPHKAESKSYFPPKGYAFLLFQEERGVQKLIETCVPDDDKLYITVSSPTIKNKAVQIRPWRLADADFVLDASMPLDPRKTVFVGGVPRPLKAYELAMIMDRLYGGVCYAGIDTDPELKYPKGAGRVAFSNQQSYIAAISARFVQLQHGDIDKRVEVKPYVLDDQMCDECHGQRCGGKFAPFFCANVTCLQYYCEQCWGLIHSREGREYHKPLVKEGADRPRAVPFRWTPTSARTGGGTGGTSANDSLPSLSATASGTTPLSTAGLYYGGGSSASAGFSGSTSYVPPPPSFPWTTGAGAGAGGAAGFSGGLSSRARHHHHQHHHQQHQLSRPPPLPSSSTASPSSAGGYHHIPTRFGSSAGGGNGSVGGGGSLVPPTSSSSLNRCSSIDQYQHSTMAAIGGNSSSNSSNSIGGLNNFVSGGNGVTGMLNVKKEDLLKQRLAKLQSITPTNNGSP
uniref:RRM domain-containing protein n=1 Tax=Anopheles dirus TaxID=7168 RepID=A0A182NG85_9DIPT